MDVNYTRQVFIRADPKLHRDQIRVVNVLRGQSKCESLDAEQQLRITDLQKILDYIAQDAPAIIHVSPVACDHLLQDTHYRSAFELQNRNEGYIKLRLQWESACFHKLYDGVTPYERPKYGALNILNTPDGHLAARSYGQWYMTLSPNCRKRITVATGDTVGSRTLGVLDFCAHVVKSFSDNELNWLAKICNNDVTHGAYNGEIYREIQIHGEINLSEDIVSLHVPTSQLTNETALQFSKKFGVELIGF